MEIFDFEKKIKELEKIVEALEKGDVSLDRTMELYEQGTKLAAECGKALDEAEFRIRDLSAERKGEND